MPPATEPAELQDFRTDLTEKYIEAISKVQEKNDLVRLCRINKGFEFYDFSAKEWTRDESFRWWDVNLPANKIRRGGATVFEIIECLNSSKIFCVTHVESCGLTGIEALMSGCKIYIPKGKDEFQVWGVKPPNNMRKYNGTFIKNTLLEKYMNYRIFDFHHISIEMN